MIRLKNEERKLSERVCGGTKRTDVIDGFLKVFIVYFEVANISSTESTASCGATGFIILLNLDVSLP